MRSAHVERLIRITHKQQIQEIKFISEADTQELNLLGYPNHFTRYCTFLRLYRVSSGSSPLRKRHRV